MCIFQFISSCNRLKQIYINPTNTRIKKWIIISANLLAYYESERVLMHFVVNLHFNFILKRHRQVIFILINLL